MPETGRQRSGTVDRRGRSGGHRPVLASEPSFRHVIYAAAGCCLCQPLGLIGDNGRVQVAILGPLEVRDDGGEPVVISGARLRDLIARLALAGGRPVSTSALAEAVWGDEPPADLANALQTLVSRARRALGGPHAIEQSAAGYRLVIRPGRRGRLPLRAAAGEGRTEEAMRLWRGTALADAGKFAAPHAQRLQQLQLDATVARLASEIAASRRPGTWPS